MSGKYFTDAFVCVVLSLIEVLAHVLFKNGSTFYLYKTLDSGVFGSASSVTEIFDKGFALHCYSFYPLHCEIIVV